VVRPDPAEDLTAGGRVDRHRRVTMRRDERAADDASIMVTVMLIFTNSEQRVHNPNEDGVSHSESNQSMQSAEDFWSNESIELDLPFTWIAFLAAMRTVKHFVKEE
jgi:hypothetical protein